MTTYKTIPTTYEVIPQSGANEAENAFMTFAHATARALAANNEVADGMMRGKLWALGSEVSARMIGVNLSGIRPAWLNTMADLCALSASANHRSGSQYSTLAKEAEGFIYGFALALVE